MPGHDPIDFASLAAALLQAADALVPRWLPNGVERNGRWYIGDFDGGAGESANVNLKTGQWIDNAAPDDECGGDLISLYARLQGLNNGQAARRLMDEMGWSRPQPERREHRPAPRQDAGPPVLPALVQTPVQEPVPLAGAGKRKSNWRAITPVPAHAPAPNFRWAYKDEKKGAWIELDAVRTWRYENDGVYYGHVARFERVDSKGVVAKETLPRTWCVDEGDGAGTSKWHWKQWEAPRPLYLAAGRLRPGLPVVLVEGEKCADAGHGLLPDEYNWASWPGGCKAWQLAAWFWLAGFEVIMWPDCDAQRERLTKADREAGVDPLTKPLQPEEKQPGVRAMTQIGQILLADHGCKVRLVKIPKPGAVSDGWDIADAIAQGWDADQVRGSLTSAPVFVPPSDEARAKAAARESSAAAEDEEGDAPRWRRCLLKSAKGATLAVRENAVLALDGYPDKGIPGVADVAGLIAFNEFTNNVVKTRATPWGTPAGEWLEADELLMGQWLVQEHWLPPMSRGTLEESVIMVAQRHRFHPVRRELDALRGKWDGVKRLRTWLRTVCLEEDEFDDKDLLQQYLARVGTWLVMAMCARVMDPGCKFDYMTIFEGPQGWGKSTLARVLGGDYFADTGLILGEKDSYQNLQGIWVYEWGELDSLARSEVTKVKQFTSSQKDRFRASFDRRPRDYPRQCVFVGTTNEDHYLTDLTGNRRFWPVRIERPVDLAWVREHRAQLLAEALQYVEAGERFHPTPKEQRELFDMQQEARTVENSLESAIQAYLYDEQQKVPHGGINGATLDRITGPDLATRVGYPIDKQTANVMKQLASAMRRLGWTEHRPARSEDNPSRTREWVRPPKAARREPVPSRSDAGAQPSEAVHDCPF